MVQVINHYFSDGLVSEKDVETTSSTLTFEEMSGTNVYTTDETYREGLNYRRESLEKQATFLQASMIDQELLFILLGLAFLTVFGVALWFYVKN